MRSLLNLDTVAEFLSSRMVEVIAGPDKQIYRLHVAALTSSESPSLKLLVSEEWDPGNNKVIDWSHTEADTVLRFITYLYTGDYRIPDPEPRPTTASQSNNEQTETHTHETVELTDSNAADQTPEPIRTQAESEATVDSVNESDTDLSFQKAVLESFDNRPLTPFDKCVDLDDAEAVPTVDSAFDSDAFPHATHSYRKPILALAHLYCFAVYHFCPLLQQSTLRRILSVLQTVDCSQPHAQPELAALVQFVYENTVLDPTNPDPMRKIISQFVAINYTQLIGDDFEEVFAQGGDFVVDVMKGVRRRLMTEAESNRLLQQERFVLEEKIVLQDTTVTKQERKIKDLQNAKDDLESGTVFICKTCRRKRTST